MSKYPSVGMKRKFYRSSGSKKKRSRYSGSFRSGAAAYPVRPLSTGISPSGLYNARFKSKVEKKYKDTPIVSTAAAGASITLANGIAQGTDFTQRIGRRFTMKSIYMRGFASMVDLDPNNQEQFRVMLIYDNQPNGVAPVILDILTAAATNAANNLNNRDRFVTIYDKVWVVNPAQTLFTFRQKYRKLNCETTNSGVGATIADIATGALWIVTCPNSGGSMTTQTSINVRIRFTDQ